MTSTTSTLNVCPAPVYDAVAKKVRLTAEVTVTLGKEVTVTPTEIRRPFKGIVRNAFIAGYLGGDINNHLWALVELEPSAPLRECVVNAQLVQDEN